MMTLISSCCEAAWIVLERSLRLWLALNYKSYTLVQKYCMAEQPFSQSAHMKIVKR